MRSGSRCAGGTRYGMPALRILRLARTSRCAIVGSGTRNARAISAVVSPASVRSVSATCASTDSAGWQHVKISRRRSSSTPLSSESARVASGRRRARRPPAAWRRPSLARRSRSSARLRAVVVSHAPGLRGTPSRGQRLERQREGVLRALLGEVPVAGDPDQRRDDAAPLVAERDGDRGLDVGAHISQIGRTSIEPSARPGSSPRPRSPRRGPCSRRRRSRRSAPWSRRTGRRR